MTLIAHKPGATVEDIRHELEIFESARVALKHGDHDQSTHAPKGSRSSTGHPPLPGLQDGTVFFSVIESDPVLEEHYEDITEDYGASVKFMDGTFATDQQVQELGDYRAGEYRIANEWLRDGKENVTPGMDAMIKKIAPLPTDAVLYRGVSGRGSEGLSPKSSNPAPGTILHDKGWSSTSYNPHDSLSFMKDTLASKGKIMAIRVPKGTRVLPGTTWEKEFILNRGSRFKVLAIHTFSRGYPPRIYDYDTDWKPDGTLWEVELVP